ncbi:hypothetical protein SDC9_150944 [bioreactor metagenome]|uniref:Uncharacterized protein n=1 Tax=bioreactor metagenome TaxID=1076179 RepID=A0A645ER30_9ZZZZ
MLLLIADQHRVSSVLAALDDLGLADQLESVRTEDADVAAATASGRPTGAQPGLVELHEGEVNVHQLLARPLETAPAFVQVVLSEQDVVVLRNIGIDAITLPVARSGRPVLQVQLGRPGVRPEDLDIPGQRRMPNVLLITETARPVTLNAAQLVVARPDGLHVGAVQRLSAGDRVHRPQSRNEHRIRQLDVAAHGRQDPGVLQIEDTHGPRRVDDGLRRGDRLLTPPETNQIQALAAGVERMAAQFVAHLLDIQPV